MKGITTRDIEHYNPRCNARGTIKAGAAVHYSNAAGGLVVTHRHDASFMSAHDFAYSYVLVPASAVKEIK